MAPASGNNGWWMPSKMAADDALHGHGRPDCFRQNRLSGKTADCKNWEKITLEPHMSSPFLLHRLADVPAAQACSAEVPRSIDQAVQALPNKTPRRGFQRPMGFGQRPVFKDFFLTKRPTADRKSQVQSPLFFSPVGGIASRLNYMSMKASATYPACSIIGPHRLLIDAATDPGGFWFNR